MIRTVEAVIDEQGEVRLLEPVALPAARRALVTILEEDPAVSVPERGGPGGGLAAARGRGSVVASAARVPLAPGTVVLVPFPFSDLSQSKLRPAVALAATGRGDWILCQITSNPYADPRAVELTAQSFRHGSLQRTSYARPGKLFTASEQLAVTQVGRLHEEPLRRIVDAIVRLLRSGR
jgi:mRNA interferase MazF